MWFKLYFDGAGLTRTLFMSLASTFPWSHPGTAVLQNSPHLPRVQAVSALCPRSRTRCAPDASAAVSTRTTDLMAQTSAQESALLTSIPHPLWASTVPCGPSCFSYPYARLHVTQMAIQANPSQCGQGVWRTWDWTQLPMVSRGLQTREWTWYKVKVDPKVIITHGQPTSDQGLVLCLPGAELLFSFRAH